MTTHITKTWFDGEKVVTQEIPESEVYKQEPVALVIDGVLVKSELPEKYTGHLYTAPPQRKPLTDKAITQVIDSMPKKMKGFMVDWDLYEFARAIEAAHGIKEEA